VCGRLGVRSCAGTTLWPNNLRSRQPNPSGPRPPVRSRWRVAIDEPKSPRWPGCAQCSTSRKSEPTIAACTRRPASRSVVTSSCQTGARGVAQRSSHRLAATRQARKALAERLSRASTASWLVVADAQRRTSVSNLGSDGQRRPRLRGITAADRRDESLAQVDRRTGDRRLGPKRRPDAYDRVGYAICAERRPRGPPLSLACGAAALTRAIAAVSRRGCGLVVPWSRWGPCLSVVLTGRLGLHPPPIRPAAGSGWRWCRPRGIVGINAVGRIG
jgi:hypothetical protein